MGTSRDISEEGNAGYVDQARDERMDAGKPANLPTATASAEHEEWQRQSLRRDALGYAVQLADIRAQHGSGVSSTNDVIESAKKFLAFSEKGEG